MCHVGLLMHTVFKLLNHVLIVFQITIILMHSSGKNERWWLSSAIKPYVYFSVTHQPDNVAMELRNNQ